MFIHLEKLKLNNERGFTPTPERSAMNQMLKASDRLVWGFTPTPERESSPSAKGAYSRLVWGFTLIETLAALFVFTLAMAPIVFLSNSANNIALGLRDNLTAAGLAQEGIEIVRAVRDNNFLNSRPFDSGLSNGTYTAVWNSDALTPSLNPGNLKIDNGLYNYNTGTDTKYTRVIIISKINPQELKVTCTVSWLTRRGTKSVSAEEHLYNWNQ